MSERFYLVGTRLVRKKEGTIKAMDRLTIGKRDVHPHGAVDRYHVVFDDGRKQALPTAYVHSVFRRAGPPPFSVGTRLVRKGTTYLSPSDKLNITTVAHHHPVFNEDVHDVFYDDGRRTQLSIRYLREVYEPEEEVSLPFEAPHQKEVFENERQRVLRTAEKLVTGDRNNSYGPPTQDFARTAAMLTALGYCVEGTTSVEDTEGNVLAGPRPTPMPLKGSDVARIMACVKLSRSMWSDSDDHWIDLAGYASCGWENVAEENESA